MRLTSSDMEPEFWAKAARAYYESGFNDYELIRRAVKRLVHGDVSETRHGIRVALRPDLGDDRSDSGADAYWPGGRSGCRCRYRKMHGECSHEVAVTLFEAERETWLEHLEATAEF